MVLIQPHWVQVIGAGKSGNVVPSPFTMNFYGELLSGELWDPTPHLHRKWNPQLYHGRIADALETHAKCPKSGNKWDATSKSLWMLVQAQPTWGTLSAGGNPVAQG